MSMLRFTASAAGYALTALCAYKAQGYLSDELGTSESDVITDSMVRVAAVFVVAVVIGGATDSIVDCAFGSV